MTRTKDWIGLVFTLTAVVLTSATFVAIAHDYASAENAASANLFERGRYLVKTTGCGYLDSGRFRGYRYFSYSIEP
jgi:hypothetical protein